MFWNSLGKAKKAAQNTRHENGFRRNGRHYCRVRSLLLRPGCDSTYRYKTSRRQAGLCLACITEPHVRTCVWMCEVTCTHVGYSKMTMGGDARWKKEGVAAMWVNIHKHAVSRGDVTASQISLFVSTCTSSVYITSHFSLFSLCYFPCFFVSFFITCSFLLLLLTSCPSAFTASFLSVFFFPTFCFFLPLLIFYIHIFRKSFLVFFIFSSFL